MNSDWKTVLLGELCTLTKGNSPTLKTPPGDYPLVVTGPAPLSSENFQFQGEAVCIPMVSSTGHGHASLKRVHYASGRFAVANIVTAAQVKDPLKCETKFLYHYLQHFKDDLIVTRMQGTANVSLSQKALGTVPILLPPLAEQRRIVDLIGAVDDAREAAQEHKTAMLEMRSAYRRHSLAVASNSAGTSRKLAELATTRLGKMLSASTAKDDPEAPYLRNADVQWNNVNIDNLKSMPFSQADRVEFTLRAGDVLICEGGEIGRCAVLDSDLTGIYFQKAVHRVRCRDSLNPYFLQLCMEQMAEDGTLKLHSGGSTIPHLTGEKLRKLPIPTVPLDEQIAIARTALEMLQVAETASAQATTLHSLRSELLNALLSGAHTIPKSYDEVMDHRAA